MYVCIIHICLYYEQTSRPEKDMQYNEGEGIGIVPPCLITNLKEVKFICFYSRLTEEGDISFLRFILKNARVLHQIQLINNKSKSVRIPAKLSPVIQQLLLSYPRASKDAQISFVI